MNNPNILARATIEVCTPLFFQILPLTLGEVKTDSLRHVLLNPKTDLNKVKRLNPG